MKNSLLELIGWYESPDERILSTGCAEHASFSYGDLRKKTEAVRCLLSDFPGYPVVLFEPFAGFFLAALAGALLEGRDIYLPGHENWNPSTDGSIDDAVFLGSGTARVYRDIAGLDSEQFSANPTDPTIGKVIFLSSGSTGEPKQIVKECRQIANEVSVLTGLWGQACADRYCASTASHQHLYGFLFYLGLALAGGAVLEPRKVEYPESLKGLPDGANLLVSSPAFLSRLSEKDGTSTVGTVFSSGGPLPAAAAAMTEKIFNAAVFEVFGSTETGGIAYRRLAESRCWSSFPGIKLSADKEGRLVVVSDYLSDRTPYVSQDLVVFDSHGNFVLKGRADSIVKIEEKRISLLEMAERLESLEWVRKAILLPLQNHRRELGALIVPAEDRLQEIAAESRKRSVGELKSFLRNFYTPVLIPRKWRFLRDVAVNDMGKVNRATLIALFAPVFDDFHCEVIALGSDILECVISFPDSHRFFNGHFHDDPILPGVSQVHTILRLAEKYLGLKPGLASIPRAKFSRLVRPDEKLLVKAKVKNGGESLSFSIVVLEDHAPACKGSIHLNIKENE